MLHKGNHGATFLFCTTKQIIPLPPNNISLNQAFTKPHIYYVDDEDYILYEPCLWKWSKKDNSILINGTKWRQLPFGLTDFSCFEALLIRKLLLFANSVLTLLEQFPHLAARLPGKKIRWCCLRSCILALCATNIHQASAQSISNNRSCNLYHISIYQAGQGGRSGDGKKFLSWFGSFFWWNLSVCTSNLTTNGEGRREFAVMATWNSSRHRGAVFNILVISLSWLAHHACRFKDL